MEEKKGLIAEFKEFIMRGNVLDLAVAVVIGGAFTAIVDALIASIIDPIISLVAGNIPFEEVKLGIFPVGILIIALVVFLMVKAINGAMNKMKKPGEEEEEILGPTTEELLVEIRDLLKEQNGGAKVEPTDKG